MDDLGDVVGPGALEMSRLGIIERPRVRAIVSLLSVRCRTSGLWARRLNHARCTIAKRELQYWHPATSHVECLQKRSSLKHRDPWLELIGHCLASTVGKKFAR